MSRRGLFLPVPVPVLGVWCSWLGWAGVVPVHRGEVDGDAAAVDGEAVVALQERVGAGLRAWSGWVWRGDFFN